MNFADLLEICGSATKEHSSIYIKIDWFSLLNRHLLDGFSWFVTCHFYFFRHSACERPLRSVCPQQIFKGDRLHCYSANKILDHLASTCKVLSEYFHPLSIALIFTGRWDGCILCWRNNGCLNYKLVDICLHCLHLQLKSRLIE